MSRDSSQALFLALLIRHLINRLFLFGYIIRNFRKPKPRKEWTVRDYKVDATKEARKMAAFTIKDHGYKEPLTDRQKRVVERIRNGTDFHVFNSMEEIRKRFK